MTTVAMNNLWNYIDGLQLSQRNRKWLADRLTVDVAKPETKKTRAKKTKTATFSNVITPELQEKIDQARKEFREGKGVTCKTVEESIAHFRAL